MWTLIYLKFGLGWSSIKYVYFMINVDDSGNCVQNYLGDRMSTKWWIEIYSWKVMQLD